MLAGPNLVIATQAISAMVASMASLLRPEKTFVRLLLHLEVVVIKADGAEADRHQHDDPHEGAARIGPQQDGADGSEQDHQPAHGRRAHFRQQMGLRTVGADRLALALLETQSVDHRRTKEEDDEKRRHRRAARAESDVAKNVQGTENGGVIRQKIEHLKPRPPLARLVCEAQRQQGPCGCRSSP